VTALADAVSTMLSVRCAGDRRRGGDRLPRLSAGGPSDQLDLTAFPPGRDRAHCGFPRSPFVEIAGGLDLAIDGMDLWPILEIDGGASSVIVIVTDLTLTRGLGPAPFGWAGAATVRPGDTAVFRRVRFLANRAFNGGGALQLVSGPDDGVASASVRSCLFEGNAALGPVGGGAIYASDGSELTVEGTSFVDNQASASRATAGRSGSDSAPSSIDRPCRESCERRRRWDLRPVDDQRRSR
jgi:predicted outer membrane repeat protein